MDIVVISEIAAVLPLLIMNNAREGMLYAVNNIKACSKQYVVTARATSMKGTNKAAGLAFLADCSEEKKYNITGFRKQGI